VSFAAITLCVASQRLFIVVDFVTTQYGNFWIYHRMCGNQNEHIASSLLCLNDIYSFGPYFQENTPHLIYKY
jgi:hypothetical protein